MLEEYYKNNKKRHLYSINKIVKNYHDSEDIVQQAFTKACLYINSFDKEKSFEAWFTRILYLTLADYWIYRGPTMVPLYFADNKKDSIDYQERINISESFFKSLNDETERNKLILLLYYVKGYNSRDIEQLFRIDDTTITKICRQFKDKVKHKWI